MTYGLCHRGHMVAKYLLLHSPAPSQPWACPTTGTPSDRIFLNLCFGGQEKQEFNGAKELRNLETEY